jgi:hypothetical protein
MPNVLYVSVETAVEINRLFIFFNCIELQICFLFFINETINWYLNKFYLFKENKKYSKKSFLSLLFVRKSSKDKLLVEHRVLCYYLLLVVDLFIYIFYHNIIFIKFWFNNHLPICFYIVKDLIDFDVNDLKVQLFFYFFLYISNLVFFERKTLNSWIQANLFLLSVVPTFLKDIFIVPLYHPISFLIGKYLIYIFIFLWFLNQFKKIDNDLYEGLLKFYLIIICVIYVCLITYLGFNSEINFVIK